MPLGVNMTNSHRDLGVGRDPRRRPVTRPGRRALLHEALHVRVGGGPGVVAPARVPVAKKVAVSVRCAHVARGTIARHARAPVVRVGSVLFAFHR